MVYDKLVGKNMKKIKDVIDIYWYPDFKSGKYLI